MSYPKQPGKREFPLTPPKIDFYEEQHITAFKPVLFDAKLEPMHIDKAVFHFLSGKIDIKGAKFKVIPSGIVKFLIKPNVALNDFKVQNVNLLPPQSANLPIFSRGEKTVSYSGSQTGLIQFISNLFSLFLKGKIFVDTNLTVNALRLSKKVHIKAWIPVKEVVWSL